MNWSLEAARSLAWIGEAYGIALLGFVAATWWATRFTRWGGQFWRLARPYFDPRRSPLPLVVLAGILLLSIVSVRLEVLLSYWYKGFYDSLQALDARAFQSAIVLFALLATLNVLQVLLAYWVGQGFDLRWRSWLNQRLTADWLADRAYYRAAFVTTPIDNPDQRIQVDIDTFVSASRRLAMGCVASLVSLVEFSVMLWGLSAALTIAGVTVPRAMVVGVYLYVIVASLVAFRLGRPLIALSYAGERLAGDFRYALVRVREYAESIAFHRGEAAEEAGLSQRFAAVIGNAWAMVYRSMKFDGFNLVTSQGAVILPYLAQAPRLFSGAIKLGDVMQTGQAFGQVQQALSFFRLSYDSFAQYRAVLDRLCGFLDATSEARALPGVEVQPDADALVVEGLRTWRPDGTPMLHGLDLRLVPGEALLIRGASGVGKTTLLRALAGLWPGAAGRVRGPVGDRALFLPQRPYLPLGTLRAALAYPRPEQFAVDAGALLEAVQLGHLADRLDVAQDWSRILSMGEQQRLAVARVLLHRPRIVFLDEATSAMDEGLEHAMYRLIARTLDDGMIVSVGHRSTLEAFHPRRLDLGADGRWTFGAAGPERPSGLARTGPSPGWLRRVFSN